MSKLKNLWGYIVAAFAAGLAFLLYILNSKQKELDAIKSEILLAETKKDVKKINKEIEKLYKDKNNNDKKIKEYEELQILLKSKKKTIASNEGNKTSKEIEKYWEEN